eukprot:COSAG01_NODE_699_length_14176_cov_21.100590_21_plen_182_part_01
MRCVGRYSRLPPTDHSAAPAPVSGSLSTLCRESSLASGRVVDRIDVYSDRRQLRQDISEWALNAVSRKLLVLGGPGAGKTTLLTELVEDETAEFHGMVLAAHFCAADDTESLKPQAFVSGIATQLYKRCCRYREYVDATDSVREKVKKLLSGDFDGDPMSGFRDLLMRPLKAVFPGDARPEG